MFHFKLLTIHLVFSIDIDFSYKCITKSFHKNKIKTKQNHTDKITKTNKHVGTEKKRKNTEIKKVVVSILDVETMRLGYAKMSHLHLFSACTDCVWAGT